MPVDHSNQSRSLEPNPCENAPELCCGGGSAGGGKGAIIYETVVKPMLSKAGIEHVVRFTERHGHAKEIVSQMVAGTNCVLGGQRVNAIVCVSGDGMLHECINGLAHGCGDQPQLGKLLATMPLAIVPAGSGNGVAASLYGRSCSAFTATQRIVDGSVAPLDTMAVRTAVAAAPLFDLHFCCWACFADHDYLTEKPLRWLGPALKMILAPAIVILRRQLYTGTSRVAVRPRRESSARVAKVTGLCCGGGRSHRLCAARSRARP